MVAEVAGAVGVEVETVDVSGRPALEARYRELLPAVEVDGELAFTYFVDADALRTVLATGREEPQAQS